MNLAEFLHLSPADVRSLLKFTLIVIVVGFFCALTLSSAGDDVKDAEED
ncbi:hypothetical protein [Ralstonia holmesii]|nr:hypothetical protein [Ralstonia sp. LMG 32967]CAJ0698673.1 hypothetical protein R11007_02857 [Ralstonia sp. LMG 32967]